VDDLDASRKVDLTAVRSRSRSTSPPVQDSEAPDGSAAGRPWTPGLRPPQSGTSRPRTARIAGRPPGR